MSDPFIDTRNTELLKIAANILTYPHDYCRKERHCEKIIEVCQEIPDIIYLVRSISIIQESLAALPSVAGGFAVWSDRLGLIHEMGIETEFLLPHYSTPTPRLPAAFDCFNTVVLEGVLDRVIQADQGELDIDALRLAAACVWLSDHLALVVLKTATVEYDKTSSSFLFKPRSDDSKNHLHRLWFGAAFEKQSLRAAAESAKAFAIYLANQNVIQADFADLYSRAMSIFAQHWRLPQGKGPVVELFHKHLEPLLKLLLIAMIASDKMLPTSGVSREHAKLNGIEETFSLVFDMQSKLRPQDRLFETADGNLVLGTRDVASGLLAIAESIADQVLGAEWHSRVSPVQKDYVIERLRRCSHIEVLDFEIREQDTSCGLPLDIDFLVRDEIHRKIYAVQLKHLEFSDKGGILYWINRIRNREGGLGKGVKQLENLKDLISADEKIKKILMDKGVLPGEFDDIVPVLLHNIGPIDFWCLQSGIILYDIGTFCNVLDGRSSLYLRAGDGAIATGSIDGEVRYGTSPHNPDSVIAAYINDPFFQNELGQFAIAAKLRRSLIVDSERFVAEGLGV